MFAIQTHVQIRIALRAGISQSHRMLKSVLSFATMAMNLGQAQSLKLFAI